MWVVRVCHWLGFVRVCERLCEPSGAPAPAGPPGIATDGTGFCRASSCHGFQKMYTRETHLNHMKIDGVVLSVADPSQYNSSTKSKKITFALELFYFIAEYIFTMWAWRRRKFSRGRGWLSEWQNELTVMVSLEEPHLKGPLLKKLFSGGR